MVSFARSFLKNDQLVLSAIAVVVGLSVGLGVVLFRETVGAIQYIFYGFSDEKLTFHLSALSPWRVLLAPIFGGVLVGIFFAYIMPGRRPKLIGDVMEAVALKRGRMSLGTGILAAFGSALSLGVGASVGREGPAVHLGATICSWFSEKLHLGRSLSRTLLGCGAAAAVASSFNAPLAGALFAHEVIVGHYALTAFAPVVISSVAATMVSRAWFGDFPAFALPEIGSITVWEYPFAAILGIICSVAAIIFMHMIFRIENKIEHKKDLPLWVFPVFGGVVLGVIGLIEPEALGVGYGLTDAVLNGSVPFWGLFFILLFKFSASVVSIGSGFSGGVFSPSITLGAVIGGLFGMVIASMFPVAASGSISYALIGMGAMAAAVMGAPISTILIVFELTSNYPVTIAVMIGSVVSSVLTHQLVKRKSYFYFDLDRKGIDITAGTELSVLKSIYVKDVMDTTAPVIADTEPLPKVRKELQKSPFGELFVVNEEGVLQGTITLLQLDEAAFNETYDNKVAADVLRTHPPVLQREDTLDVAVRMMLEEVEEHIAVIDNNQDRHLIGCIHETRALLSYSRALIMSRAEERGERLSSSPF